MTFQEAKEQFERLFSNQMSEDEARSFLVELYKRGESAEEIAAAAEVMREHSVKLPVSEELRGKLIDNCGTGGDKSGSFNISTTVSLLLAACGCYVAKHGNRSITSKSGSADMLEALGINLNLSPEKQVEMLEKTGFCFIFAINHHPAMKFIMPIRKSLPHRTIFNILGPITNPAGVKKQLIGVFSPSYIDKIAQALKLIGTKSAMVVSSKDGMDEISISDITYCSRLENAKIEDFVIKPEDYGLERAPFDAVKGGDAIENAQITKDILDGRLTGPKLDIVLLNAGAALVVDGKTENIKEGIEIAREAVKSGAASEKLAQIIETSKRLGK
ncbi:anthranilate phosphoribosyltransferase [Nitrosophilus alvini]|uniref:anthranilate phosphoribosyltransferase n=1 Tax=Nitrosophilus alvini TaxID=2714855 RepID=UPI00190CFDDF|nr:anthranilate phosphoribosyltransferase [Nitrosophilus alvini]